MSNKFAIFQSFLFRESTNFLSNLNSNSPHSIKSNQNVHKLKLSKEEIPTTSQMLYNINVLFSFADEQSLFLEKPEERILLIHALAEASKNYQQFSELNVKVNLLHPMSTDQNAHNLEFHFSNDLLLQFFSALSTNFDSLKSFAFKEENTSSENNENALLPALPTSFHSQTSFTVNEYANFLCSPEYSSDILTLICMRNAGRAINFARADAISVFNSQISLLLNLPLQSMHKANERRIYSTIEQLQKQRQIILNVFQ